MIKAGDAVFFMYNGERRYLKVYAVVFTADG